MPDIVKTLTIKTGKNAGQHPSVAYLYRAFAETGLTRADSNPRPLSGVFGSDPNMTEMIHRELFSDYRPTGPK